MFKEGDQVKHKRLCIEGVVCAVGPAGNSRPYTIFSDTSGVIHAKAEDLEFIPIPPKTEELTAEQMTLRIISGYLASDLSQTAKLISIEQAVRHLDFNPQAVLDVWRADTQRKD